MSSGRRSHGCGFGRQGGRPPLPQSKSRIDGFRAMSVSSPDTTMKRRVTRVRNVHVILGTSAGLVVLVAIALGWLGWRLLSQEEALQKQQTRSRLEQSADLLLTGFLRRMTETESWLSQIGPSLPSSETVASKAAG